MLVERFARFQSAMQGAGLDVVAVMPGANLHYLTGVRFDKLERPLVAFIRAEGAPVLVIPKMEYPKLRDAEPYPVECFQWADSDGPDEAFAGALAVVGLAGAALGVESLNMRFQEMKLIEKHAPGVRFVADDAAFDAVRRSKDAAEIALLREAINRSQEALDRALAQVRPGMTERAIGNLLQAEILAGDMEVAFILVQGGPTSAQPHGNMTDRPVRAGENLLIDYGGMVGGYPADITRTFFMGRAPDAQMHEVYELVKAANAAGRAACGPGVPAQEVDRATRKVIEDGGYGEYFIHRTGHGLGLEIHEGPYIYAGNTEPLAVGNVFTVEPGIYLPGVGGVRIEDNMVITPDGAESLTTYPRDWRVVGA
ncbi:MAG: Xaa-Pro peptidase family protein [Anaerolineae bacterium]|nr:Xaa-Pro peptidase family protein [Anaerolineae bacterium]